MPWSLRLFTPTPGWFAWLHPALPCAPPCVVACVSRTQLAPLCRAVVCMTLKQPACLLPAFLFWCNRFCPTATEGMSVPAAHASAKALACAAVQWARGSLVPARLPAPLVPLAPRLPGACLAPACAAVCCPGRRLGFCGAAVLRGQGETKPPGQQQEQEQSGKPRAAASPGGSRRRHTRRSLLSLPPACLWRPGVRAAAAVFPAAGGGRQTRQPAKAEAATEPPPPPAAAGVPRQAARHPGRRQAQAGKPASRQVGKQAGGSSSSLAAGGAWLHEDVCYRPRR